MKISTAARSKNALTLAPLVAADFDAPLPQIKPLPHVPLDDDCVPGSVVQKACAQEVQSAGTSVHIWPALQGGHDGRPEQTTQRSRVGKSVGLPIELELGVVVVLASGRPTALRFMFETGDGFDVPNPPPRLLMGP